MSLKIAIPGAAKDYWRFIQFCSDQLSKRMQEQAERNKKLSDPQGNEEKDITHTLIAHYDEMSAQDQRKALPMLQGDSRLIIVAGSDTTAGALVFLFSWLAQKPSLVKKIRDEIESCREDDAHHRFSDKKLINAETLHGAVSPSFPHDWSGVKTAHPRITFHLNRMHFFIEPSDKSRSTRPCA